jgi:predicted SAM-dependent methyltransferase
VEGRRLEIASGPSPRPGYEHNDINPGPSIDHVGAAQDLSFPDGTFVEIFGTGAIEHLTYAQAARFLRKAIRWLAPGGEIYLDAPNIVAWYEDMAWQRRSKSSVLGAFDGWRRWPGDEHKSFWTVELLFAALRVVGFEAIDVKAESDRCGGPSENDWHVCARARRPMGELPLIIDPSAQAHGWGHDE